jgi:hypothetical protein
VVLAGFRQRLQIVQSVFEVTADDAVHAEKYRQAK